MGFEWGPLPVDPGDRWLDNPIVKSVEAMVKTHRHKYDAISWSWGKEGQKLGWIHSPIGESGKCRSRIATMDLDSTFVPSTPAAARQYLANMER